MLKADLAISLTESGNPDEGMRLCSEALNEDPNDALALYAAAFACMKADRNGVAYQFLKRASEIVPQQESVWNNFAMSCLAMQRLDEAEEYLKRALQIRSNFRPSLNNLALLAVYDCNPSKAIALAKKSLEMDPDQWDVSETKAYAHMMLGQWEEGWNGYEKMIGRSRHRTWKPTSQEIPSWDGSFGVLHLRGEQGVGDEITYSSVIKDIPESVKVIYECDEKLEGLFRRSFPNVEVYGTRYKKARPWAENRKIDFHLLVGSLCKFFRKKDSDFPGDAFLVPDPDRCLQWRVLLDQLPGKKVGIAWTGGRDNTFRKRRSLTLEDLLPIFSVPGITWVSLQYQDPTEELKAFEDRHGVKIHHWKRAAESTDYDDTASLVNELDCVVSVCTAVVHLCGGLGKECHVLVPSKPRWWYGISGSQSVWYKSLTFWRQKGSDWKTTIHQVKNMLVERCK